MGAHPSSPVKVTDLILNMIAKAAEKDDAFLLDLAALQEKHIVTAKELLGADSKEAKQELTSFTAQLLNDISNLKSMLQAISIGVPLMLKEL
jgi:bifunctional aspartokinase / homoserine dehydrogenase 1